MKKIFLFLGSVLLASFAMAQEGQLDTSILSDQALVQLDKGNGFVKDMRLISNVRYSSHNQFTDGTFQSSHFHFDEFRMELLGNVTDKISYRFRNMYARANPMPSKIDDLRFAVDLLYMEYKATPKLSIAAGKMLSEWGSYELDMNPVYMYAYNDLIKEGDFFLPGVRARWFVAPKHSLTLQVVNSGTRGLDFPNAPKSKARMGATLNWRGNFMDGMFCTMWSYSLYSLAAGKNWQLISLGNQLKTSGLTLQYDFKFATEDIDKTGVASGIFYSLTNPIEMQGEALDVHYIENWMRAEYFLTPQWSITAFGMSNISSGRALLDNAGSQTERQSLRNRITLAGFVEYHLFKKYNVKVFGGYVSTIDQYSDYARNTLGAVNGNKGNLMIGIVSPLVLF